MQETQELWVWHLDQEDYLEKEMAIHSSVLAWRIPWTEGYSPRGHKDSDMTEQLSTHSGHSMYSLPTLLKNNNLFYFKVIPCASWPTKTMLHDKHKFSYYSEDKDFHIFYLVKHHSEILWESVKKVLVSSPFAEEETEAQRSSIISLSESTWSARYPQPALLYSSLWRNSMFTKITVGEVFDYT